MLAAVKPTVGRVSRYGVIPITADQDTAGPMARTVTDAAILLGVARRRGARSRTTPRRRRCTPPPGSDYTAVPEAGCAEGRAHRHPARVLLRRVAAPGGKRAARRPQRGAGARRWPKRSTSSSSRARSSSIRPTFPSVRRHRSGEELSSSGTSAAAPTKSRGKDADCTIVVKYGMKRDFNKWLATLGPTAPVKTLTELREWNLAHQKAGAIKYGQSRLDISDEDGSRDATARDTRPIARRTCCVDRHQRHRRRDEDDRARRDLLFPGSSGAGDRGAARLSDA